MWINVKAESAEIKIYETFNGNFEGNMRDSFVWWMVVWVTHGAVDAGQEFMRQNVAMECWGGAATANLDFNERNWEKLREINNKYNLFLSVWIPTFKLAELLLENFYAFSFNFYKEFNHTTVGCTIIAAIIIFNSAFSDCVWICGGLQMYRRQ